MHEQEKSHDLNERKQIFDRKTIICLGINLIDKGSNLDPMHYSRMNINDLLAEAKEMPRLDFRLSKLLKKKYPDLFSGMYQFW